MRGNKLYNKGIFEGKKNLCVYIYIHIDMYHSRYTCILICIIVDVEN